MRPGRAYPRLMSKSESSFGMPPRCDARPPMRPYGLSLRAAAECNSTRSRGGRNLPAADGAEHHEPSGGAMPSSKPAGREATPSARDHPAGSRRRTCRPAILAPRAAIGGSRASATCSATRRSMSAGERAAGAAQVALPGAATGSESEKERHLALSIVQSGCCKVHLDFRGLRLGTGLAESEAPLEEIQSRPRLARRCAQIAASIQLLRLWRAHARHHRRWRRYCPAGPTPAVARH